MELMMPFVGEHKKLELVYKPVTLEIYYNQFGRDLSQDVLDCLSKYGSFTRSLALRLIWSCVMTKDSKFIPFIMFIDSIEYKINDFVKGWGAQFTDWFIEQISQDMEITNPNALS